MRGSAGCSLGCCSLGCCRLSASTAQTVSHTQLAVQSALTMLFLVGLVLWLRHWPTPIVPKTIFQNRTVVCGVVSAFGFYFSVSLLRFMVPWYVQEEMNYTQAQAGLVMMTHPVMMYVRPGQYPRENDPVVVAGD